MGKIYPQSVIFIDHQVKRDSKLVKWVKLWPIIFDKNDPSYPDAVEKKKVWEIIADNMESTAKVCEERWTTLLEKYEKYKKGYLTMHETLIDQLDEYLNISTQSKTTNPDFLKQFEEGDYFLSPSENNSPFFIQNLRLHGRNKDFTVHKNNEKNR